ncbi:MAG: DUF1513 domain-containing protein [Alphaproteobacteria bacterium]|nr:DUF1513 domain-containing protein [Alphaproteobacteria bacterium]
MGPMDRRTFIRSAGAAFVAALLPRAAEAIDQTDVVFGTAYMTGDGAFGAALLDDKGRTLTRIRLPARGHEVVFSTADRAVVFARRPGTFAMAFSTIGKDEPLVFSSPADRHFYGHGAFSPDGKLLYATENDFEQARGAIGIYDATDRFRRIGEYSSYGTGPHDIHVSGDTLAVANGGLETHPDFGRTKLNVAAMQPSLAFVDRHDGSLIARHFLASDLSKVSIRHMVGDKSGRLFIAGQHEGNPARIVPLLARWHPDTGLSPLPVADNAIARMKGYIGSIAINGDQLAVTSPKSGVMLRFDPGDPSRVEITEQPKICGLAAMGPDFAATSMVGTMQLADGETRKTELLWDNHLSGV